MKRDYQYCYNYNIQSQSNQCSSCGPHQWFLYRCHLLYGVWKRSLLFFSVFHMFFFLFCFWFLSLVLLQQLLLRLQQLFCFLSFCCRVVALDVGIVVVYIEDYKIADSIVPACQALQCLSMYRSRYLGLSFLLFLFACRVSLSRLTPARVGWAVHRLGDQ